MTEYELTPSPNGCECIGNGSNPDVECQCDECPHFQECFPYMNATSDVMCCSLENKENL